MARLNGLIQRFIDGKPALGTFVPNGSIEDAVWVSRSGYDFVVFEMEHGGMDFPSLRVSLQFLLDRAQVAETGLQPAIVPMCRIPPNSRERNQWVIKQALDYGVYGVVVPHLNTAEEAVAWCQAARYPQLREAPDYQPEGQRGTAPGNAQRYWGLDYDTYYAKADLWPLDPDGELLLMPLIEEEEGTHNIGDILKAAPGIGAIFFGEVDLSVSLGHPMQREHPDVVAARERVLGACKEAGVPCGCLVTPQNVEARLDMGFSFVVGSSVRTSPSLDLGRQRLS